MKKMLRTQVSNRIVDKESVYNRVLELDSCWGTLEKNATECV